VEVLVEFISHEDPFMAPLFRELARLMKERLKGLYITQVEMDKGRVGPIHRMLLREGEDFRLGALKSEDAIFERLLPPRLARGPQVFEINDPPSLVYGERIRSLGTTYVFGLGHVGACVCHLARYADFRVVGIDDRSEFADPEKLIDADQVIDGPFEDAWGRIGVDNDSYIVIVTRGHAHDRMVLARALKTEALYIGMIGSRRKNRIIFEDLVSEGFTQEDINRVYAPIGLDIAADTPEEIGFSIVSQMIKVRNSSPGPQ
jgi:xanthine dehydrogenase accessory factor